MTREDIVRIVEAHRQDWPTERIRNDPAGFLSVCDTLLSLFRDGDRDRPAWLTGHWAELLFGDHPAADDEPAPAGNDPAFFSTH